MPIRFWGREYGPEGILESFHQTWDRRKIAVELPSSYKIIVIAEL
ncbi:MAG TPA: hypothetical protein VJB96_05420 [Patescibacteria group bacterium]|nr:hypothetical protein [Patescibacteria group bacterium]